MPETLDGLALVRAQRPAVLREIDLVRLAVHVTGEVLGGPAQLEERLLDLPALRGVHGDGVGVDAGADQRGHALGTEDLLQDRPVRGGQDEAVRRVLGERETPVPVHGLGDVDQERVRDGVAAVLDEGVHDLLGVVFTARAFHRPSGVSR